MSKFDKLNGSVIPKSRNDRVKHEKIKMRSSFALFLAIALHYILTIESGQSVFSQVQAVNSDKVSFQVFEIDSSLVDIMWCGNTNEVILVQSESGTIYRSRDRGESWKKLHSYMQQTGQNVLDEGQQDIGHVKKMMQSPVDDNLVVFTGSNGINWVTEDCGANLRALNSGKKIHEFHFHPKQRGWALAAGWTSCADFADDEPCEIYKELYVTKDLGASWQYLKSYVFDFAWGYTVYSAGLTPPFNALNVESRVFITHDPKLKGHQKTRERWKQSVHLYYSDDFFKSEKQALEAGNSIVMTNHYMFVAKAISSNQVNIQVSRAEGGFLDFRLARMPNDQHITDHFTVMDTSEKSVFLYVSNDKVLDPVGNLFVSDGLGYRFTHSLENIIKAGNAVDFETIESLDGTFIANKYDINHGVKPKKSVGEVRQITDEDIQQEEKRLSEKLGKMNSGTAGNKKHEQSKQSEEKGQKDQITKLESFENKIKTYISHNKGACWELIKAPQTDLKGKDTKCFIEDGCSLHLNMYSQNDHMYAPPYSQESAIGIVMAVGNIGEKLSLEKGARKGTFLSRDGGVTFSEIAKVPLIYEFGDHGGLLVAAPNIQSTTQIRYSWNEGKTWTKLKITDEPIFIDNIIIEPKSTSQQFVIYGSYDNTTEESEDDISSETIKDKGQDVMITLDFSGLQEPKCKNVENPGSDNSDFELWSPHDDGRHGSPNKCFLGQQVTYIRRKQDSECFNGEDFERQTMRVPCLCTEGDYECDVNYIKNKGGQCELITDALSSNEQSLLRDKEEDCKAEGFYYVTQGYRKIPGNQCYGGVKLDPIRKPCTSMAFVSSIISFKTVAIALIGFACLYYGWPIIEAILLVLPIPDPKDSINKVKSLASSATGIFSGVLTSKPRNRQSFQQSGYQSNLEQAPDAYIEEDDDSDNDIGKPNSGSDIKKTLDYDSDDKNDEEAIDNIKGNTELIDLGAPTNNQKSSKNIPRLSGPH